MKITKSRKFTFILAFVMALILVACSGGNDKSSTAPTEEIQMAFAPIASDSIQSYDYTDIGKMFIDAGFTNVSMTEVFDIDPDSDDSIHTNVVSIGGVSVFENAEAFHADSAISIVSHRPYEKYTLSMHIDFVPNLLFSRYDVNLLIDGVEQETLEHGQNADLEFRLKAGDYHITFAKTDSSTVNGSTEIKVNSDMTIWYKISCNSNEVTVENNTAQVLAQQEQEAEDARIAAEAEEAERAVEAERAAEAEKSAETQKLLESHLPLEKAKRVAIVALTNYCTAVDVFMPDGNTFDPSKFHSYSDTSGNFFNYYISVKSWGEWSAKDAETWRVENLVYVDSFGNEKNAACNVRYPDENYLISNVVISFGNLNDPNKSGIERYSSEFVIAPELVMDDREQTEVDSHYSWVMDQFSFWDGSHIDLKKMIIKNLNDENSFKHTETNYRIIYSEDIRDEINKVLISANKTQRVEIGDLWIVTQFTAKNSYNATIKSTAYGIASFKNNTVTLVAIE